MMMFWFAAVLAGLSLLGALIYRSLWTRFKGEEPTPAGYGGMLGLFLVCGATYLQEPADLICSYSLIAAAAAIYWCDDIFGLGARLRILVQFGSGFAVCYLLLASIQDVPVLVAWCLAAGLLNVVLTNVVNFSDGADLNMAAVIVFTVGTILLIGPDAAFMRGSAITILAFVLPFALLNSRPRTLYFGDSGCFVFASFLTIMTVSYFRSGATGTVAFAAIPMALPVYDAFYVFVTRVRNKEDLLSRNYLHLYQRLQAKYRNFAYLLPQPLNIVLVAVGALILRTAGLPTLSAVMLAMLLATPVFYAICRRLFLQ